MPTTRFVFSQTGLSFAHGRNFLPSIRQTGQATSEELQARDFRRELEEKEQVSRQKRDREKPRSFTGLLITKDNFRVHGCYICIRNSFKDCVVLPGIVLA